jgi:hypothetical protein
MNSLVSPSFSSGPGVLWVWIFNVGVCHWKGHTGHMGAVHNHSRQTPTVKEQRESIEDHHRGGIKTSLEQMMAEFTRIQSDHYPRWVHGEETPAANINRWGAPKLKVLHEKHKRLTRNRDRNLETLLPPDRSWRSHHKRIIDRDEVRHALYKNVYPKQQVGPLHIHDQVLVSKHLSANGRIIIDEDSNTPYTATFK